MEAKNNYLHVVPNSYFYTDLNMIIENIKSNPKFTMDELLIGLENTIKNGYNIESLKTIENYKSLLKLAGAPTFWIENASSFNGEVTKDGIDWALSKIK